MPSEHRLHPLSILFQLGGHLKNLLVPALLALFAARASESNWELWAMLLIIPYTIAAAVRALSLRYRFDPAELVIRTGFVFRRERRIPYDRIHNIDAIQNVVHRLVNVMEVRLETAGSSGTEAELSVLSVDAFREMRQRVHGGRERTSSEQPDAAAAPPSARADPLLVLPTREVALLGLLQGRGLVVVATAFGVLWELGLLEWMARRFFGVDAADRGVVRQLILALAGQGVPPTRNLALMLGAFLAFVLALRVLSAGLALVRFHGFVLTRADQDLRSEFGLLTRVTATIPTRRIQMLTVHQSPLHRVFSRAAVRVDTAGGHAEQEVQVQRRWLAPIVHERELPALVGAILPFAATAPGDWPQVHPAAFRRAVRGPLFTASAVSLALVALLHWWTLAAMGALTVWAVVATRGYVASLRWAVTDTTIVFRSGWLWRYETVAPLAKIQVISLRESPFDRRYGMATVLVDTAGGKDAPHRVEIPYLPREAAQMLCDRLVSSAASTKFRW